MKKTERFRLVTTTEEVRRRWHHADPEEIRKLLAGALGPQRARAVQRHLHGCLKCTLVAGRLAGMRDPGPERLE